MGKGLYCQLYVLACGVGGEAAYQWHTGKEHGISFVSFFPSTVNSPEIPSRRASHHAGLAARIARDRRVQSGHTRSFDSRALATSPGPVRVRAANTRRLWRGQRRAAASCQYDSRRRRAQGMGDGGSPWEARIVEVGDQVRYVSDAYTDSRALNQCSSLRENSLSHGVSHMPLP